MQLKIIFAPSWKILAALASATTAIGFRLTFTKKFSILSLPPSRPAKARGLDFRSAYGRRPTAVGNDIIVQEHRGEIEVETEEGKFTEFVVRLPKV